MTRSVCLETFCLRIQSAWEIIDEKLKKCYFKSKVENVKKIPKLDVFSIPLVREPEKTTIFNVERHVYKENRTVHTFYPKNLKKLSWKEKERIYYILRFRLSCSTLCVAFLDSIKKLEELGFECFSYNNNIIKFEDVSIHTLYFKPERQFYVNTTMAEEVKRFLPVYNDWKCFESCIPSFDGKTTSHQFIKAKNWCIDLTFVQFGFRGKYNRLVGIFSNEKEYSKNFPCHKYVQKCFESDIEAERKRNFSKKVVNQVFVDFKSVVCNWCGRKSSKRCGVCHSRFFCNSLCQKNDWGFHKHFCKK